MPSKIRAPHKSWIVCALLSLSLGSGLSAYQQGSFFLFDIKKDADKSKAVAGRIAVPASVFKEKKINTEAQLAQKKAASSMFSSDISVFGTEKSEPKLNQFQILEEDTSDTKTTTDDASSAPSGFFFNF